MACILYGMKNPVLMQLLVNPIALRIAKTPWSFGCFECNRVKYVYRLAYFPVGQ